MIKALLQALLPPLLLGLLFTLLLIIPSQPELQPSAISPDLPLDYELEGWYAAKLQESEGEREALAADTRFSKAAYLKLRQDATEPKGPTIVASIVYSGNEMNSSIHRPERCLPAQGHIGLQGEDATLTLSNGRTLTFRRLSSHTQPGSRGEPPLQHIHYYIFIGSDSLQHSHFSRTFKDMYDRVAKGRTQRWAYFQVGAYWGGDSGISEQVAESQLQQLIRRLLPRQVDWEAIKN